MGTNFKDKTLSQKIIYISSVLGALVALSTGISYFYNVYSEHRDYREKEFNKSVLEIIHKEDEKFKHELLNYMNSELLFYRTEIDSLKKTIKDLREGSEFFAVGFRGDGTGKLWYRNEYGIIYSVFFNYDINQYYYINENGKAVYL
jgi:hypothetical protein